MFSEKKKRTKLHCSFAFVDGISCGEIIQIVRLSLTFPYPSTFQFISLLLLFTYFIIYFWPWPCNAEAARSSSTCPPPPPPHPSLAPSLLRSLSLSCCRPTLPLTTTGQRPPPSATSFSLPRLRLSSFLSAFSSFFEINLPLILCAFVFPPELRTYRFPLCSSPPHSSFNATYDKDPFHKSPQNLPPKIKLRGHWGRSVCLICVCVCVCVCARRCLGVVHVSISAHDL